MSGIPDLIESITTKDRHFLSLFIAIRTLMKQKAFSDVEKVLDDMIQVQRKNLQEWSK